MIIKHRDPLVYLQKHYWFIIRKPEPGDQEKDYLAKVKIASVDYRYTSAGREFVRLDIINAFPYIDCVLGHREVNTQLWETKKQARFAVLKMLAKDQVYTADKIKLLNADKDTAAEMQCKLTASFNKKYNKGKSKCSI